MATPSELFDWQVRFYGRDVLADGGEYLTWRGGSVVERLSFARCRCLCGGGGGVVEVVERQSDLLAWLGAYRPRLPTVATARGVGQHDARQVAGSGGVQRRRRHAFATRLARQRRHCGTTTVRQLFTSVSRAMVAR